jgi:3-oxoacyl-(acyl-carrier-protein) synthase
VVVTGLSTFTSLGHDPHTFFDNLCEGKCGIGPVTNFNCDGLTPQTTHQVHPQCPGMRRLPFPPLRGAPVSPELQRASPALPPGPAVAKKRNCAAFERLTF